MTTTDLQHICPICGAPSEFERGCGQDRHTGSTVAAYLGFNPYTTPSEQWEYEHGGFNNLGKEDDEK